MTPKKFAKIAIDFAPMGDGGNNHSHGTSDLRGQVIRSYGGAVITVKPSCGNTAI